MDLMCFATDAQFITFIILQMLGSIYILFAHSAIYTDLADIYFHDIHWDCHLKTFGVAVGVLLSSYLRVLGLIALWCWRWMCVTSSCTFPCSRWSFPEPSPLVIPESSDPTDVFNLSFFPVSGRSHVSFWYRVRGLGVVTKCSYAKHFETVE